VGYRFTVHCSMSFSTTEGLCEITSPLRDLSLFGRSHILGYVGAPNVEVFLVA
jgi:hypothetical protein